MPDHKIVAGSPVIRLIDVYKTYDTGDLKVHALCGVSLEIERGGVVAISARSSLLKPETSTPSRKYWPLVGRSRQPRMFIMVDLPEPEAPMIR